MEVAISIALKSRDEIISGLIFDPIKNEMFYAEKNNGAFFNNQRIRVSKKNQINECLFVTGGKINGDLDLPYRKSGCAALDMAYVASGRYDGFFQHNLCLWDIAAGILLVREAGGFVSDFASRDRVMQNGDVVAANPSLHAELLKHLAKART